MVLLRLYLFVSIIWCIASLEYPFLGCYKDLPSVKSKELFQQRTANACVLNCGVQYFRFANFRDGHCICKNYLSEQITNTTCKEFCLNNFCDDNPHFTDVYGTGNLVPGPPRNFAITNVTNYSCHITWDEPDSFVEITGYVIKATVLHTYSSYSPISPEWIFSNNTFQATIIVLMPATKYNITLSTKSPNGNGATVFKIIETRLGEPSDLPPQPTIIKNEETKVIVNLTSVSNNNGPVTAYRVIVVLADDNQAFDKDNVFGYEEAKGKDLSYYIAAEISPQDINKEFVVGDGKRYGKYYNAPLGPNMNYNFLLGIVSKFNGETKVAYSEPSGSHNGVLILNVDDDHSGDSPTVIISLSVAIGLLSFMLLVGIIGFVILKSRIVNRRQRLSDNQELTLQGPMIEVENNGYIHEEEHIPAVSHYRNLKQKVRTIPASQLKIEPTHLLGVGRFGKVNSGTLHENDNLTTVTCYSIHDKKMSQDTKRGMLQELDLLIKTGKHSNIINLIGTSETPQMVLVVMEYASMNLKDLLLGSRDALPGRFTNMFETQAIEIAIQICSGMAHLHSCNIIHKQLCARSVMIVNGFTPKIGSYGLAQFFTHNKIPDYTRWTALEVFKAQPHNPKSDIWSFACLLWEICALGGTPYGSVSNNNDIPERITKGLRLPQLQYISDDFYQIMLDCWQLDCDERPHFTDLINSLENLKQNTLIPYLNFNLYSNFQYEQFYPDMELAVRPVF